MADAGGTAPAFDAELHFDETFIGYGAKEAVAAFQTRWLRCEMQRATSLLRLTQAL
jgi:hypothetical protein